MAEQNYTITTDLKEAQSMVGRLEQYVRQDELYVQMGGLGTLFGGAQMPALTVGALLLRLNRLTALQADMTAEQRAQLEQIRASHESVRSEWRLHYDEKLKREAHSRLVAMRRFFEECAENPRTCASNYRPEALRRTIVEEVINEMARLGIEDEELPGLVREIDSRLRRYVRPDAFLWDDRLQTVYGRDQFWWLYMQPEKVTA